MRCRCFRKKYFAVNKINQLESDDGKEYFNEKVKDVLSKYNVKLHTTYSDKGSSVVERFNRNLLNLIQNFIHMTANNTKSYRSS